MEDYRLEQSGQEVQDILNGAAMQSDLTAETERATEAEQTLQGNIDAEERDRKAADLTLQGNIDAEELRAKAAEKQNADDIDALEEKVPSGASSSNKLATESYVDDSVATATATFRGTYNLVSDLHLTVNATEQQIATALALAISTADNNDYCFVQVPTSSGTPTEIKEIDRYKFNGTAWSFEYKLNNSGFTTAQWAAINSGITSGDVTKLAALPTNAQLTALLAGKQDVLTFDNVPTQGSSHPVKSGGVYSAIDDEKTARENADSSLSSAIEAILLLIPSAATSLNKLADKAFVNSSIATASATFRGTYNLVTDLSLTVSATHAQIATALAGAVSDEDDNDYAFVQIPTSDATPTQIAKTERYKFNGTAWEYEYDLNNSGYTAAQWAAINSGITEALVTKLSALPTNAELTSALGVLTSSITTINQKIPSAASQANQLVDTAAMESYIVQVLDVLTATFNVTSSDGHVTVSISQVDGKITSVAVNTSDIASAASLSLIAGRVTTAEGNISTNAADIANLQDAYAALTQSALVVVEPSDTWPVASPASKTIYRVVDRVNTPPQNYSDYMWNGTTMVLMATYDNAIDDEPTAGSNNLVKSGGVVKYIDNLRITHNDYYMDMQTKENTYFNYQIKKYVPENGWKASGFIPVTEGLIGAEHRSYIGRISLFDINRTFIKQIEFRSTYSGTQELSVIAVPENTAYFVFTEADASYDSISFVSNSALREMKKVAGYKIIQKVGMTQGQSVSISMPLDYLAKGTAFSIKINQSSSITDRQYSYTINGTTYNVNANEKPLVLLDSDMTRTLTVYFGASSVIGTGDIEVEVDVMGEEQLMNSKVEIVGITSPYLYFNQERNVSVKFDVLTYTYNSIRYSINYDWIKQNLGTIEKFDYNLMLKVPITFLTTTKILVIDPFEQSVKYIERDDLKFYQFVLLEYSVTGYVQGFYYDYYKNYLKNINGALVVDHLPLNICSEIETKECDEIIPAAKHNDFSFVYFSDDHRQSYKEIEWHPYDGKVTNMTSMAAYKVYQDTPANTILNCGDTGLSHTSVGGKEAAIEMLHYFETIPSEMQLYCQGNHDRGIEQPIMSRESFFCMAYKKLLGKEDVVFGNAPSSYFYKNFNEYKIRFVVLDMYDIGSELDPQYNDNAGYRQAQLEWLINNALVVENNWSVIIVTHSAPVSPEQGMSYNAGPNVNADALRKILEDFKSGSAGSISQGTGAFAINLNYDFSVQGARDVIGLFSGHCHVDNIVKINGINYVSIACGYIDVQLYIGEDSLTENLGTRVQNSMSAICLDYVSINKSQRTVSLKRIGFGNDRTFTY